MSFGRLERRARQEPISEINVTPLVDVMLVLLVLFILTAPLLAGAIRLDLPRTAGATAPAAAPASLRLDIDRSGQAFLNDLAVDATELTQRLAEAAAASPDAEVQLRADQAVPYGRVVEVMGAAQAAGLTRIGFVAEPTPALPPSAR